MGHKRGMISIPDHEKGNVEGRRQGVKTAKNANARIILSVKS